MLQKSIESALRKAQEQPHLQEVSLDGARKKLQTLKERLEAPFERESELSEKASQLEELNATLEARGTQEAEEVKTSVTVQDLEDLESQTADEKE
jgi:hypothetical protein